MLSIIDAADVLGVAGIPTTVEVHVRQGLPGFNIVGCDSAHTREVRDRVRAAIMSSGYTWPLSMVTVNIVRPRFHGDSRFDLAIALGVLAADEQIPDVADVAAIGELGLDGTVRSVRGIVPSVETVTTRTVLIPLVQTPEAREVRPVTGVSTLTDAVEVLETLKGES